MFPIRDDQPRYSTAYVNWFLIVLNILIYLFKFFQHVTYPRGTDFFAQ